MINIDEYLKAQKEANRDLNPAADISFAGMRIPNEETSSLGVSEGCVVIFPDKLEGNVVEVNFPGARQPTKAIVCQLLRKEDDPLDKAEGFEFYLSTPLKAFTPTDKKGKNQPRLYTKGQVHDWFKKNVQVDVDKTLQAMCGKKMKFYDQRVGQYADPYRQNEIRGFSLWTIDWVGDAPADI